MSTRTRPSTPKKTTRGAKSDSGAEIRVEDGIVRRGKDKDKKAKKKDKKRGKKKPKFTAKGADRHELYQYSVQSPDEDCSFFARVYKSLRKKDARHLREDFCGTALLSATWLGRNKKNTAEGFDIDPDPVSWGIERNFEPLGDVAKRCRLQLKDVREPSTKSPDVRIATNFSYWIFKERRELVDYFRRAYEDLKRDGIFILDIYGGPEALNEVEEEREVEEGFTYVWDQVHYHPATGDYKAYIHFRFKDGTELKRAFRYDWRLWFLTEVRDALTEAGFSKTETYWEGTDEDGESGNGVYRKSRKGENCEAWVTYIVGVK
ncbi:MAG: class I SAM-dependent methyltransferase [Planctomycetota bacterium]